MEKPSATSAAIYDPQQLPVAYRSLFTSPVTPTRLTESIRTDCTVIGMGITGNSAAIHLAQQGVQVVQLEANEVSSGGSGRAFGLVVPYGKHGEDRIRRDFGAEQAERYINEVAQGPDLVRSMVKSFNIPNAIHGEGWFLGPYTPQATISLAKRVDFWRERGADIDFVEGKAAAGLIGSELYPAGMHDRRALSINPLAYTRGLAVAAAELGVKQYANTPALSIVRYGDKWKITTPQGEVYSQQVLICTDSYSGNLWPGLKRNLVRIRGHQAATEILDASDLARVLPSVSIVTDTRHTWSGLKKLPDGRLHLSAGGPSFSGKGHADMNSVTRRLAELYPWMKPVHWEHDWSGWVGLSPDQYPTIKSLDSGIWAAFGYSGRGLAAATLMGRQLARIIKGENEKHSFVPIGKNRPLPLEPVARLIASSAINWYRAVDAFSKRA